MLMVVAANFGPWWRSCLSESWVTLLPEGGTWVTVLPEGGGGGGDLGDIAA